MFPIHAIAEMVLALPVAYARPVFAAVALVAGFLGGVVPDLDRYAGRSPAPWPTLPHGRATTRPRTGRCSTPCVVPTRLERRHPLYQVGGLT
jgi:hypothetical protein